MHLLPDFFLTVTPVLSVLSFDSYFSVSVPPPPQPILLPRRGASQRPSPIIFSIAAAAAASCPLLSALAPTLTGCTRQEEQFVCVSLCSNPPALPPRPRRVYCANQWGRPLPLLFCCCGFRSKK
eukprot:RCo006594